MRSGQTDAGDAEVILDQSTNFSRWVDGGAEVRRFLMRWRAREWDTAVRSGVNRCRIPRTPRGDPVAQGIGTRCGGDRAPSSTEVEALDTRRWTSWWSGSAAVRAGIGTLGERERPSVRWASAMAVVDVGSTADTEGQLRLWLT